MTKATSFNVGGIRIERILEMEIPFVMPGDAYPDAPADAVEAHRHWMEPAALCPETGKLILAIQTYLARTSRHTILIDTCVGCGKSNHWFPSWNKRTDRSWLGKLAAAGVRPEEIDFVFCTHLHADHCGWNTQLLDGRWVPTFPNAKYILSRREVEHYQAVPNDAYRESVLPVIEAGQAQLVEMDHALDDEVWIEPTPGHTPGHVAVRLSSQGHEAVMCGDLLHSPIQCHHPDWRFMSDWDPAMAKATRRSFLEASCESGRTVLTAHFPSPSVGQIVEAGAAFEFRSL